MKKLLALMLTILLLFLLSFSFTACGKSEPKEISCEDIIAAYESAGYYVVHGEHKNEADNAHLCYIKANLTEGSDSDYIYFITCFTEEEAQEARETDKYNLLIWLYATISGEGRWLKTGTYGKIEYSYYNSELIKPFNELIKTE